MKTFIIALLLLLKSPVYAQLITYGSHVLLGNSDTSYAWSDISTDHKSGATIVSKTSAGTEVKNLKKGVWYFQRAKTVKGKTIRDTILVKVTDEPPANSILVRDLPLLEMADYISNSDVFRGGFIGIDRANKNGVNIDKHKGKLYATLEDGCKWDGRSYNRSELYYDINKLQIDTSKTFIFEWQGYFPKPIKFKKEGKASGIFQIQPFNGNATYFFFAINSDGGLYVMDNINGNWIGHKEVRIANISDFYKKAHTIRTTWKEGVGFVKVEIDGVQKYYREGNVGSGRDYIKFAGLYDFNNVLCDPLHKTGNIISLATEDFKVYTTK